MNTPQLVRILVSVATVAVVAACNRPATQEDARQAASKVGAEVKTAAVRAGDTLADSWLTSKIQAQYFGDKEIKARYIDVSTHDNVVTLSGYVPSESVRQLAVALARNTDGVRRVDDQLLIGQRPQQASSGSSSAEPVATTGRSENLVERALDSIDDARITSAIQAKFFLDSKVKVRHVDVGSHGGVVTLRGEVGSDTERAEALLLARNTEGVQRVEDNLTVNASLDGERSR